MKDNPHHFPTWDNREEAMRWSKRVDELCIDLEHDAHDSRRGTDVVKPIEEDL